MPFVVNSHIFKLVVQAWVKWEVGRSDCTWANRDHRRHTVLDKYYLIPHYSGKRLMLKLCVGVENKLEDQPSEMCTCS